MADAEVDVTLVDRTKQLLFQQLLYQVAAGILPPEFRGVEPMGTRHIWIPVGSWTRYMNRDLQRGGGNSNGQRGRRRLSFPPLTGVRGSAVSSFSAAECGLSV